VERAGQPRQLEYAESTAIELAQKRLARHRMIVPMASFHPSPAKPRLRLPRGNRAAVDLNAGRQPAALVRFRKRRRA
jgi:hypothetical protein